MPRKRNVNMAHQAHPLLEIFYEAQRNEQNPLHSNMDTPRLRFGVSPVYGLAREFGDPSPCVEGGPPGQESQPPRDTVAVPEGYLEQPKSRRSI